MADCCNEGNEFIYACSGGSDVGFISDRLARMLSVAGYGNISCLAGIGGDIEKFLKSAKEAKRNIVIDGCGIKCGKKMLKNRGIACENYVITEFGFEKNKAGVSDDTVKTAFDRISGIIENDIPDTAKNSGSGCCCGG
ncbi:MAG: putative zinc-binding protein [Candidatus Goldiibacteriota bacterium]